MLRKTGFRRVGDQAENINSFVSWNIQDNLLSWIFVNQGNHAERFLKIVVYLTFPHLIPYKILHVYLPEMRVGMTYTWDKKYPELHIYVSLIYDNVDCGHHILCEYLFSIILSCNVYNF